MERYNPFSPPLKSAVSQFRVSIQEVCKSAVAAGRGGETRPNLPGEKYSHNIKTAVFRKENSSFDVSVQLLLCKVMGLSNNEGIAKRRRGHHKSNF